MKRECMDRECAERVREEKVCKGSAEIECMGRAWVHGAADGAA